ncbi:hypothetical protein BJ546DRAFT_1096379, partial [Cryomyces antarcticus]
ISPLLNKILLSVLSCHAGGGDLHARVFGSDPSMPISFSCLQDTVADRLSHNFVGSNTSLSSISRASSAQLDRGERRLSTLQQSNKLSDLNTRDVDRRALFNTVPSRAFEEFFDGTVHRPLQRTYHRKRKIPPPGLSVSLEDTLQSLSSTETRLDIRRLPEIESRSRTVFFDSKSSYFHERQQPERSKQRLNSWKQTQDITNVQKSYDRKAVAYSVKRRLRLPGVALAMAPGIDDESANNIDDHLDFVLHDCDPIEDSLCTHGDHTETRSNSNYSPSIDHKPTSVIQKDILLPAHQQLRPPCPLQFKLLKDSDTQKAPFHIRNNGSDGFENEERFPECKPSRFTKSKISSAIGVGGLALVKGPLPDVVFKPSTSQPKLRTPATSRPSTGRDTFAAPSRPTAKAAHEASIIATATRVVGGSVQTLSSLCKPPREVTLDQDIYFQLSSLRAPATSRADIDSAGSSSGNDNVSVVSEEGDLDQAESDGACEARLLESPNDTGPS